MPLKEDNINAVTNTNNRPALAIDEKFELPLDDANPDQIENINEEVKIGQTQKEAMNIVKDRIAEGGDADHQNMFDEMPPSPTGDNADVAHQQLEQADFVWLQGEVDDIQR